MVNARSIKTTKESLQRGKFKYSNLISAEKRKLVFDISWPLMQNVKYIFLRKTTKSWKNIEKLPMTNQEENTPIFISTNSEMKSFVCVCKKCFLGNISQKPVYAAHVDEGVKKDHRVNTGSRPHP